jgi:hypothetical protein
MTATTPVDRVGEILEGAGFRRLANPLSIGGLKFDLPAAYVGSDKSSDLVLVADTALEQDARLLRTVEGVGRALDVLRSKRPVTIVLAGPRPKADVIDAMAKVCRVLPIGTQVDSDPATALANWLAVLLPLTLPEPRQDIADPLTAIRAQTGDVDQRIRALMEIAPKGADAVQAELHDVLTSVLDGEGEGS